jgi:iron complex outermembrane receptor protein
MKLLLIIIASLVAFPVLGQYTISGTIKDKKSDETLIGSTIYFPDLYKGATTDIEGKYSIKNLPSGNFNIEFSFIGYKTQVLHIHLSADTIINIDLVPDLKEMKEVIVTGLSKSTELKVSPVPAVITTQEQLFEYQATNLIDGIAQKPGIEQLTTGPAISKPIIRGLGGNRILSLYNGLRQEGQQWGAEHGIEIDEFSIDKIEIIKGPGSIAYGSDALAGVINFLTPHEIEADNVTGAINAGYQTNNNQYSISGSTSGNINGFNWRARGTLKEAGNYQNAYDGKVFNSGFNEFDWDAQIGLNKSWGFAHIYVSSFDQHLGIITGNRDINGSFTRPNIDTNGLEIETTVTDEELEGYKLFVPQLRLRHFRIGTSNQFYFNKASLMLKLDHQVNQREVFGHIDEPNEQEVYMKLNTFNYNVKYFLADLDHWETAVGINGMFQTNENLGHEVIIPDYNVFDVGIYILTQKQFDNFMLSGGIRIDNRSVNAEELFVDENGSLEQKFAAFSKNFSNLSGSIGASYQPDERWNFKLNISRGFRAPTLAELSSNGAHEGAGRYEIGNTDLKAETSLQADLGVELETDHASIQIAGFYNYIENFIYIQKLLDSNGNDSIPDPGNGAVAFQYVQNNAQLFGGEVGIDIHPHPFHWLHFENTFSIVYGQQLNQPDSSKNLPFMPAPKFKSELRADFNNEGKMFTANFFRIEWEYYFEQNRIFSAYDTETVTPAYNLFGAGIGTTINNSKGIPLLSVVLLANNILDVAYQSHLNRLKYTPANPATGRTGVFNMGRNFAIKIRVPLTFKSS